VHPLKVSDNPNGVWLNFQGKDNGTLAVMDKTKYTVENDNNI